MNEKRPQYSIIVPVFNEEDVIEKVVDELTALSLPQEYEVIIVNDGSTDGTRKKLERSPFPIIDHSTNRGYGAALKTGIRHARGEKIITLDSDGQHASKYIPALAEKLASSDMVIGVRNNTGGAMTNRTIGKRVLKAVGEYLVEEKLEDFNSGYRGFDRRLISKMIHIMPNGFSFSTTSTLAFAKEGYGISTVPIEVQERSGRKSNVRFFRDGSKTLLLIIRICMLFNPLKIFVPSSIIVCLAGTVFGVYGIVRFGRLPNTSIIVLTLGMFLFFFGLIADQVSIMNRRE